METKYLIIGNSVAGINCMEGIREIDKHGKIIVVSDESITNYSRPLISYYLGGKIEEGKMAFREPDFYKKNSVELLLDTVAENIDVEKRKIVTNKGEIYFEKLLIATGGKPIVPEIEGYSKDLIGVFTFTKFSDAKALKEYIKKRNIEKSVIIGGGLIGLKCAEGLIENGIKIHLVEIADRLLSTTLDKDSSDILESTLKEKGCYVYKGETIKKICSKENIIKKVILTSGKEIETELLVIAIGVRPDLSILKNTSIKFNRGILVDEQMKTSVPYIYAAGDVAQAKNLLTGENALLAIWPVAARQGKIAGINMAGGFAKYDGWFAMNAVEIADYPIISFGITNPPDIENFEVITKKEKDVYKKIVIQKNRIVGCIFLGKIERSGIYAGLIKNQVDVSDFKQNLLDDNFGLLSLPEKYRKHMVVGEGIEV